ncbi:hypothetical protein OROMI_014867 [Orobanche minor]
MSTANSRRPSFSSSTTSSLAKRHASSSFSSSSAGTENVGKATAAPTLLARKRAPLGDISNQKNFSLKGSKSSLSSSSLVKKGNRACTSNIGGFSLSNAKSSFYE